MSAGMRDRGPVGIRSLEPRSPFRVRHQPAAAVGRTPARCFRDHHRSDAWLTPPRRAEERPALRFRSGTSPRSIGHARWTFLFRKRALPKMVRAVAMKCSSRRRAFGRAARALKPRSRRDPCPGTLGAAEPLVRPYPALVRTTTHRAKVTGCLRAHSSAVTVGHFYTRPGCGCSRCHVVRKSFCPQHVRGRDRVDADRIGIRSGTLGRPTGSLVVRRPTSTICRADPHLPR